MDPARNWTGRKIILPKSLVSLVQLPVKCVIECFINCIHVLLMRWNITVTLVCWSWIILHKFTLTMTLPTHVWNETSSSSCVLLDKTIYFTGTEIYTWILQWIKAVPRSSPVKFHRSHCWLGKQRFFTCEILSFVFRSTEVPQNLTLHGQKFADKSQYQ